MSHNVSRQSFFRESRRLLNLAGTWLRGRHRPAVRTCPGLHIILESKDTRLDLCSQVCQVKAGLVNYLLAFLAIPPHDINGIFRTRLFENNPDGICEADRIVGGVCGQQIKRIFVNGNVDGSMGLRGSVHGLEQHRAFMLIEELGSGVDVVVCSSIGAANDHDSQATRGGGGWVIDAVIVDWGLQKVRVVLQPA